ncbi:uncharacterized protein LOC117330483 isoform X1 [Pecten maximus]|uniref:uncharacterized protein LOC117330483 isoform X1 n=2 Tax=Pecten maximus TaxID=6579 RepID=UPI001457E842|nr:uncharacterized protein LOC117330483 isoform X1 [Pecten maximus]
MTDAVTQTFSDRSDTVSETGTSGEGVTMGAGASQEEVLLDDEAEPQTSNEKSLPTPQANRAASRTSLQGGQLHRGDGQDVPVTVTEKGFSIPEVTIIEGQFVSFMWEDSKSKLNIVQVVHDGEKLRPVIGGFEAKAAEVKGHYDQQFNSEGDYKFAINGIRCTPLSVTVKRKVDLLIEITDEGFQQSVIYVDQGHSVKWHWTDCKTPHAVQKVEYSIEKKCFVRNTENSKAPVTSDSYRETFPKPGLFFFKTESNKSSNAFCVVHVREAQREFRVEILDRSFQPMILLVEEGDRVWWSWDKFKCKKSHSVYQIEAPPIDQDDEEPYQPVEDGFRWATPSKQGLMSQEFFKPGVYYFSDQNQQEAAEYIGTIIVKPKQQEHYIELTAQKGFEQDVVKAQSGDRLWFHWDKDQATKNNFKFVIQQIGKCLSPLAKPSSPIDETTQLEDPLDSDAMGLCARVGLATAVVPATGVYHYRLYATEDTKDINTKDMNTCSVIVNPGPKNHTIHLTDSGFEPKVITVRPSDRVWWVWQGGKKPHNIIQVSHQGSHIDDGFCSGMFRDPPSAYVHQFTEAGVFYFISSSISKVFGAIVVSTQPVVHEVKVGMAVNPDPLTVKQNDIVAWTFRSTRQYDIMEVQSMDQITQDLGEELKVPKRRCLSRAIKQPGVTQFYSKSFFQNTGDKDKMEAPKISSVICDERYDNMVIRVTSAGFSPTFCYILKGQSVLWTWKGTDEEHNIVHVGTDDTRDDPLNPVKGPKSFNSGQKVKNNSFLYTFDEPGSYSVVSRGADGFACTVYVLRSGPKVKEPTVEASNGGSLKQYDKVQLSCSTPGSKIFYTIDGSPPLLHLEAAKLYKQDKGVIMKQPGIKFVRAIAVLERSLNSSIFTSKRFLVSDDDGADRQSLSSAASVSEQRPKPSKDGPWEWWDCVPHIKACFTEPGVMEVFWNRPEFGQLPLIKGYELFLNGVTYCDMFPPNNTSINISGMAGGRMYEVKVEVYPIHNQYKPLLSNILVMKCPKRTPDGGPVISLERTERPDALAVVWMAIDTPDYPISGYLIFLDEVQCGSRLVPSPDSDRCKVVIGGCTLRQIHRVYVKALPHGATNVDIEYAKTSNLLEVTLPLDFEQVELPPEEERMDEPEFYKEYIEIQEGAGQLPGMDDLKQDRSPENVELENARYKDQSVGTDTPQRSPRQPRKQQYDYNEEGIEYRKYRKGIPHRSVSDSNESEDGTSDQDSDEEESSSESGDSQSRASIPSQSNHLSFDASKSFADNEKSIKRTKESRASSRMSSQTTPKEIIVEQGEHQMSRAPTTAVEPQSTFASMEIGKRTNKTAIIQVQQSVQLDEARLADMDVTERRVAVAADKMEQLRTVDDGVLIKKAHEQNTLPPPAIKVSSKGKTGVKVEWLLQDEVLPDYTLLLYVVNIVGQKFGSEFRKSDHSFDCNIVEGDKQIRAQQHCWNVQDSQEKSIFGLMPGMTYRIFVIANYNTLKGNQPYEVQTTSSVIYYTTMGPPSAPRLRVCSVDLYEATVEWDEPSMHKEMSLKGYRLMVDNKPFRLTPPEKRSVVINKLEPGKTICVQVRAVAKQGNGIESDASRPIYISCPRAPAPAAISQETSMKTGCVLISWKKPESHVHTPQGESICYYQIYQNGQKRDIVKPNNKSNHQGYHHYLYDLPADQAVDVGVKCIAGSMNVDPFQDQVFCRSESRVSNTLRVIAPRVPHSPNLYLESMTTKGIEVTWMTPQQLGDVKLSGYRMMKNGHLYGGLIPPYINSWTISDTTLGESVTLQLIALTEHPIGKIEAEIAQRQRTEQDKKMETAELTMSRSALIKYSKDLPTQGWPKMPQSARDPFEEHMGDRYAGCRPGRKLKVVFSGLVQPPTDVRIHQVTGHSALIGWTIDDTRFHFVRPDSFRVRWWPGEEPVDNIVSDETTENKLLISGLRSDTTYSIVVDAVKTEIMKNEPTEDDKDIPEEETKNTFTLTATSDYLTLKTAKPPSKPSHLGVSANTCNSLRVAWNPPREHGTSVIGIRVDAVSMAKNEPHHISYDALPDAVSIDIEGLKEKTEYLIRVTAVTDEYFDRLPEKHKFKKAKVLPRDVMVPPMESPWLPSNYIIERTAGTEPPANLKVTKSTTTSMTLSWISPIVYGSNRLKNIIVRWTDVKNARKGVDEVQMSSYKTLDPKDTQTTIIDLVPGTQYKVVVEAVVSVKTSLVDTNDKETEKYRRIAHVMSKALYCRSRAPTEAPSLYITEFTQDTAQLYWEKPRLVSAIGREEDGKPKYIRRYLEGYKLEINGATHCCLGPTRQSCSLKKCRPGKEYNVRLVALTCTDEGKKERKKKYKGFYAQQNKEELDYSTLLNDEDNLDPSPSDDVEMILPRIQPGYIASIKATFRHVEDTEINMFGEIRVEWTIQGEATLIKDFNVHYMIEDEDTVRQVRGASASARLLSIPVERLKSVYQITVEPNYYTETLPHKAQSVQIVVPGPPDAPEIFLKSVTPEEFVIEWGEPKLWGGVKVRGYQVYMNDKRAGNELSPSHRKAVIPCRPNKTYKINLVSLSSKPEYEDSLKSNVLLVNTSLHSPRQSRALDEWQTDDTDVPVKVAQITDTSIHLDWSRYLEVEEVAGYRIEWSSVAQPTKKSKRGKQRSLNLERDNNSCIINNCLPGTTHFVRLIVLDDQGKELERSRQLTIQTSAPPEAPIMTVRACNFRYISVQWEKPTTYGDALVTGYKVFVNGIIVHTLNADQTSYTYTEGKWCHEYTFQVQALTAIERLNSKVSEPLTIVWPGAMSPHLHRLPTHSSSVIRIGWDDLNMSDGAKVKHFRGICTEEATNKVVYDFPIHPESREVEFSNLKNRVYTILLEVHLYGTNDVIRSDILRVQPAPAPDPPRVTVTVVGLDERRQLEKITCDLVNKRDRLIRKVGHKLKEIGALSHPLRAEKNREVIEGAHTLTRVEEYLEQCFQAMEHFTGQLMAHISWQCPQSRPDFQIAGYKVLIDGKQYGSPMHDGVRSIRISLPVDQPKYRLSMVSMTEKPHATSEESNSVELLSDNFRPFSFYCYHSIHQKNIRWPNTGCCKYLDSINYERQLAKKLANQGLLKKKVPPPSCSLLDILDGEYKPFMGTHNKQFPTVVLFWTPWCLSSQGVMSNFVRFAREFSTEYNYIAVTCGVDAMGATERKALIHQITTNGYRADNVLWHCTSQCASSIHEATNNSIAGHSRKFDEGNHKLVDLTEILGIAGVPTLLFVHPEGYIAWHGRYSSFDYAAFSAFMRHTFCEVTGTACSVFKCDSCQNDLNIDDQTIEQVLQLVHDIPIKNVPLQRMPAEFFQPDESTNIIENSPEQIFFKRKPSPKGRSKKKRSSQITVNSRPYSASTYVQLLKSPYMQQVVPSPKVLNRMLRPNSASGARQ